MSSDSTKIKIHFLQKSEVKNYLESQERLFLSTLLKNLENDNNLQISKEQTERLQTIFEKYRKYLS